MKINSSLGFYPEIVKHYKFSLVPFGSSTPEGRIREFTSNNQDVSHSWPPVNRFPRVVVFVATGHVYSDCVDLATCVICFAWINFVFCCPRV